METFIHTLNILLPTFYAAAWVCYLLIFFRGDRLTGRVGPILLYLCAGLHSLALVCRAVHLGHFPVATVFEAFSVLALSVLIVYLLIEWKSGVQTTGMFIIGIVFAFQLTSSVFITPPSSFNELLREPTFVLHASTAVLGYSGLAVSAVYSLLYLMLFYDIKRRRFGLIYKQLPSLEGMADLVYRAIKIGFLIISIAIVLGLLLLIEVYGIYWSWDPKIMVTLAAWLLYGTCLGARKLWGWSERRVAYISLVGFVVVLFSMVVVNLFITSFHELV